MRFYPESVMTLANRLQEIQPSLGVLVISAYLPENAALIEPSWHSIAKQYSPASERAVRLALKD